MLAAHGGAAAYPRHRRSPATALVHSRLSIQFIVSQIAAAAASSSAIPPNRTCNVVGAGSNGEDSVQASLSRCTCCTNLSVSAPSALSQCARRRTSVVRVIVTAAHAVPLAPNLSYRTAALPRAVGPARGARVPAYHGTDVVHAGRERAVPRRGACRVHRFAAALDGQLL